ncbi:gypsy retrotransposon integrase-like protein 1 [Plakobranchus ocellatus]|uniref:Gypsy retrotransposon integrase-like protein 1 n=1 Tax=Plakobranchus ocellatus TaxID=259542 RepID=A0AAV4A9G7_9GAST|nr:gypsy retrotransposon integrase-like protein 1 [Plakobranchus ocellatus]
MESVRPLEPEKKFNGGQRSWEAKTSVADQRSCFKCKKTGHIARYCTAVDSTTKKAGVGVVVKTTEVNTADVRKPAEGPTMEVTGDLQSEVEDGGREVDVRRDTGCQGVVVRKQLVDASQLTGECSVLLRIDNTALLAERAVISLRTPFLSGEVKALCIPDAICDVIVGNVEGARSPEDPDMSVMVGAATTRAQAKREAVTKPLRVPDIERHVRVDREQLIKLQQEDPRILALVDAGRTSRRGVKVVSFEKARGIVYRRYKDLGRNVDVKQVVLSKPLREYVMSVAHDSITGAHLGIRRTKDKVLSNFYWPRVDGDVTRYCRSCDVCQRTVKKGTVPRVPLEKVPLIDTPFKRVAIDLVGPINPPNEAGHRFILTLVDYTTRSPRTLPHSSCCMGGPCEGPCISCVSFGRRKSKKLEVKSSYEYVLNFHERLDDTLKIAREELEKAQGRQKHYYDRTAKRVGEKVLVLLPSDSNKLLMQWKGPFEIVAAVRINDYRINMGGKEKTFHANLLKGYIARDQDASQATTDKRPPTSSSAIPAASVIVIKDLKGEHFKRL